MNRAVLMGAICTGLVLGANCSQQGPGTSSGSGGSSGGATTSPGGSGGSGGTQSAGGTSANGGTTSAGGTQSAGGTTGAGGTTSAGGTTGNGGANSGGATGNGGATKADAAATGGTSAGGTTGNGGAGAGGTTAKGGTTGSTGGAPASGGAQGTGGTVATGGTTSSGGAPGSGGAAGSGGSLLDVVPDLATGFYWEPSCQGNFDPGGHNCWTYAGGTNCPAAGNDLDKTLSVKGTSGQKYTVTIEVRGVIGTRCYQGGTPASTAAIQDTGTNNWWYAGGTPYNASGWWNTYELHVSPTTGDASKDVYYFNSSSQTLTSGGDCEREASYLAKYTASFKVMGGGSMLFRVHDNNCKGQQNCGSNTDQNSTCAPRKVDLSGMVPQPPSTSPAATANQPPKNPFN